MDNDSEYYDMDIDRMFNRITEGNINIILIDRYSIHELVLKSIFSKANIVRFEDINEAINYSNHVGSKVDIIIVDTDYTTFDIFQTVSDIRLVCNSEVKIATINTLCSDILTSQMMSLKANGTLCWMSDVQSIRSSIIRIINWEPCFVFEDIEYQTPIPCPSHREWEVLDQISKGYSRVEISKYLGISKNTTNTMIRRMIKKFKIKSYSQLVRYSISIGTIPKY